MNEIKTSIQSEDAEDLFTNLPSEIVLNIFLRIPTRTVMSCKCVCKAWHDMLETSEFVESHLSKSVPGLAVNNWGENLRRYKIVEFVDEHRLNVIFSVDLPFIRDLCILHSSANGLLFVCNQFVNPRELFVCNPITREYTMLPSPLELSFRSKSYDKNIYGFGVSKMSGQYKVVMISCDAVDCQVYTVGSGSWRKNEFDDQLSFEKDAVGVFLNGNLHWLAYKANSLDQFSYRICCLDLETEYFSTLYPHWPQNKYSSLSVLGDYLCNTFYRSLGGVRSMDSWLMKEYGDEKSWTMKFDFETGKRVGYFCPIKVFNDGYMLMQWGDSRLLYYSKEHGRETIENVVLFKYELCCATIYAPNFLPLKTFAMENVIRF